ncbi:hypothetical protein RHA1_ro08860 (plasmid) [Rhodococcus jostii RHA1]|uniref:Uncharacterized protein n=1 Tax=Rhodococcus jostii (strain RHA1) TaxID=101510 RepID=Q0RXT2_RHOJR|nr:hypothetical protein RHA1_ro08860 [Rhodococcus jostii RHA1]
MVIWMPVAGLVRIGRASGVAVAVLDLVLVVFGVRPAANGDCADDHGVLDYEGGDEGEDEFAALNADQPPDRYCNGRADHSRLP